MRVMLKLGLQLWIITWDVSAVAGKEPNRSTMGCVVLLAIAAAVGELKKGLVLVPPLPVGDDTLAWKHQNVLSINYVVIKHETIAMHNGY